MENQDNFDDVSDTITQRQKILNHLKRKPLTTLEARNKLFIMSVSARINELKHKGYTIKTDMVSVGSGKRKIAQYSLLAGKP
jgi:hypothetical protein